MLQGLALPVQGAQSAGCKVLTMGMHEDGVVAPRASAVVDEIYRIFWIGVLGSGDLAHMTLRMLERWRVDGQRFRPEEIETLFGWNLPGMLRVRELLESLAQTPRSTGPAAWSVVQEDLKDLGYLGASYPLLRPFLEFSWQGISHAAAVSKDPAQAVAQATMVLIQIFSALQELIESAHLWLAREAHA